MVSSIDDTIRNNHSDEKKAGPEIIALKSDQFKVYKYLTSHSLDSSQWPTLDEIKDQLKLPDLPVARRLVNALIKKDGIDVIFTIDKATGKKRYGLAPQVLEKLVVEEGSLKKTHKDFSYCSLYLAEPCFGTKAHDDDNIMKGLAFYLDVNNYSNSIQQVIIQGGVIPHMPPFASKGNVNDLKFLGWVKRAPGEKGVSEIELEKRIDNDFEDNFYRQHINNPERKKITTLTDAFTEAGDKIKILMDTLSLNAILRIQLGEEDKKNIGYIEDEYSKRWAKEKEEQITERKNEAYAELKDIHTQLFKDLLHTNYIRHALTNKSLAKEPDEDDVAFANRMESLKEKIFTDTVNNCSYDEQLKKHASRFFLTKRGRLGAASPNYMGDVMKDASDFVSKNSSRKDSAKKMNSKLEQLAADMKELKSEEKNVKSKLQDFNSSMSWVENLMHGPRSGVTWFTKQYPVFADEVELAFKKAKDQYTNHFFGWELKQQPKPVIHVSPRKNIEVHTGIITDLRKRTELKANVEVDYQQIMPGNGHKSIFLIHNIKQTFSDSVGPRAIKEAKLEMNFENMVLKKLFHDLKAQPDIVLLGGHMSGGFRTQPWFKDSQHIMEGGFIKDNPVSYLVNLPTLQSIPDLQWLVAHAFKNWHTKRYETGPFASAAVVHTEDYDSVNRFHIIDSARLAEYGKLASEIDVYKNQLARDKKMSKRNKDILVKLINEKRDSIKTSFKKIEFAGDFHLGDADTPGNYSKDQLIIASQRYQKEHGLPDYVFWDEMLQGTEEKMFSNAARYLGMPAPKFRKELEKVLTDKSLSGEEKASTIAKMSMTNLYQIVVHNSSEQKHMFKMTLKEPYLDHVLAKGGKVGLTGGNHHKHSAPTEDEAVELANQFAESYIENGQLIVFAGGAGTIKLEGKQKLFSMHKFPSRQDEIYGMLEHLRRQNNDADIVVGGHRHQAGTAYADGHLVVLHPAYTTINTYTAEIGKPSNIRGFNNVYYTPGRKGDYVIEFVINPTLENIIKKEKII
jgi:hypothetical protein